MTTDLFQLEDVSLSRGGKQVLDTVSARLPKGASCIVGPSGSGKSTILRLLNRLADPDHGRVLYRSGDLRERDVLELRREVCLVPQLPALLQGTARHNVEFGPGLADRRADVDRALELAGLDGSFAQRDVDRLSVGEQQRVMLARALALEPDVLLLDEPTSALDEQAKESVEQTLTGLRERVDISFVLVTHELAQARRMADWVVRLTHNGRMVDQGSASELIAR
jgi:putative ABC transport system ATP-binding protein